MNYLPRIALFADTFHETNGAANVIRRLWRFARETQRPFLCICAGPDTRLVKSGMTSMLELKRSRWAIPLDGNLKYDPALWRYRHLVKDALDGFDPDIVHLTGLNDVSQLGFYFAHFRDLPAVASWHTNAHEYAASRLIGLLPRLPERLKRGLGKRIERWVFFYLMKLNVLARLQLVPNEELLATIRAATNRPTVLMSRGVDTSLFTPSKRVRDGGPFVLGYVGRLRPEKNVRFLAKIDAALRSANLRDFKFVIVGEGSEAGWLRRNLSNAELTGELTGEELARAYADMDLFVFPSRTDAFGNVVLEAMAAGVPAVVMPDNGPKFLISQDRNGYIARDEEDFIRAVVRFVAQRPLPGNMRASAREAACSRSWAAVFDNVYDSYRLGMTLPKDVRI